MKIKHKMSLILVVAFITMSMLIPLFNKQEIKQVYALSSYSPSGGYQGGIGSDIWGTQIETPSSSGSGSETVRVEAIESTDASKQLTARDSLKVKNLVSTTSYMYFLEYFRIVRTDGRKIYSSDAYYNGNLDVVDYASSLNVKTKAMEVKKDGGFFWTTQRAKFKSDAYYGMVQYDGNGSHFTTITQLKDGLSEEGINPVDAEYSLYNLVIEGYDIPIYPNGYVIMQFQGTGYWHNEFWGNTWSETWIDTEVTTKIQLRRRNWANNLFAQSSAVKSGTLADGTPIFFHNQPYIMVAENLNNYVKVDGNQVTPNETYGITAYYDGFHIGVTNEGVTTISLEDGAEGKYTDYKCVIDYTLPDFKLNYLNTNALDKVQYGAISKNLDGSQSQQITGAVFADKVQFEFGTTEYESPETATYTLNGNTYNLTTGTWLEQEGDYTITLKDSVGNTRIFKFTIDKTPPSVNFLNIKNDMSYKITKWYKVVPPTSFKDYSTYSFASLDQAVEKAMELEFDNKVSTFELTNLNDFIETNIADNGDPNNTDDNVRLGTYWLYKSMSNPDVYLYYFDYNYLLKVMRYYCLNYVEGPFYYFQDATNDYGNTLDLALYDNIWDKESEPAYIGSEYEFVSAHDNESYKVFYNYVDNPEEKWTEIIYNKPFQDQVSQHGLYKIKEIDFVGHETYYYIFVDKQAPIMTATVTNYGSNLKYTKTITEFDVPENSDLVYYFASFQVDEIWDNDTWYVLKVETPDGEIYNYTHSDGLPNLEKFGKGEYILTLFDRVDKSFTFKVAILGIAPTVTFTELNDNSQLEIVVNQGEEYNSVTKIEIFRNGKLLNNDNGYDEFPDKTDDELIYISLDQFEYIFNKGGIYRVELTDNYGRILTYEYKFEKDLPTGILLGVKHNGKTNTEVQFIYNATKYLFAITENGQVFNDYTITTDEEKGLTTITIQPKENIFNYYQITLYNKEDLENYNNYNFYIKTSAPEITLVGVEAGGTTSSDVYATWEETEDLYTSTYIVNDSQQTKYRRNQVLSSEGHYTIYLADSLGNTSCVEFNLDRTIDFTILENDIEKTIEEVRYTNKPIVIRNNEELTITIEKDGDPYNYKFGELITSEGTYLVEIKDKYDNKILFYFTIDLTPPTATLIGVDNYGTTSEFVRVVWEDSNNKAICYFNENEGTEYVNGENFIYNGKYRVLVLDRAGNSIEFNFTIDNKIEYYVNTFYEGYSNGDVYVLAKEYLTIEMYKNNEQIEYAFEQKLTEEGSYRFVVKDEIGNSETFYFTIIQKPVQKIDFTFRETITISSIFRDEENYTNDILTSNKLYLFEEGTYIVNVKENENEYSFSVTIDTTPPTIDLVGVENGGSTKGEVSTRNLSERNAKIIAIFNGKEIEYSLGQKLEKAGSYVIKVTDEAGNTSEYNFTIVYALNGASIALIAGLIAIAVAIAIFVVWRRRKFKKVKVEYEVETDIEDDN